MTGIDESAGSPRSDGARPLAPSARRAPPPSRRCRCTAPAAAPAADAGRVAPLLRQRPQPRVRGHAAADQQVVDAVLAAGEHRLAGQHVDDGLLEARRDVGDRHRLPRPPRGPRPSAPRRSSARRRRSRSGAAPGRGPVVSPRGKSIAIRSPSRASAVDVRAAGERQAEHPGDLVEGLAGGVVDRRAERPHVGGDVGHEQQRGVAAGDEQRQRRLGQRAVLDDVDGDVRRRGG